MKKLFDKISIKASKMVTQNYSTSFSMGIRFLAKRFHNPIYAVYGFVRFADEIVDSFETYPKAELLEDFRLDTFKALENRISLNPILNSFQDTVRKYKIEPENIETFLKSMEMDLRFNAYDKIGYDKYIFGSAGAVGLMCLRVFTEGNTEQFEQLKPYALRLGSAYQKVNFLRDF